MDICIDYNIIGDVKFDYVLEGTIPSNKRMHCAVYTWRGESVPYTEAPMLDEGMLNWLNMARKAKGYGIRRFMIRRVMRLLMELMRLVE